MKDIDLIDIPIEEAEFSILDFETTGTSAKHARVIEIGLVKVKNLNIKDNYRTFINPGSQIPYEISLLTGITNDDVINAPYFEDVIEEVKEFIGNSILVAHNARFDHSFLKAEFERLGQILEHLDVACTLKLARKLYPALPSKSLKSVVKHLRVKHVNAHRALADATATAKILLKMIKTLKEEHHVEKVSELINYQNLPSQKNYKLIKKKLANDYSTLPASPGIYFFKDKSEKVIYVGKAKSLKDRVRNYFTLTAAYKAKKIVKNADRLGFKRTNSELTALITEAELIKLYKPRFNTLLKKYSINYFLQVDKSKKYPKIKLTSKFDFNGNDYFGPFSSRDSGNKILDIIDKSFKIRECTEKDFSKRKVCYLYDIERCLAPCINNEIKTLYEEELSNVYEFFEGKKAHLVGRLIEKMKQFSEMEKYEEAAEMRDTVNLITSQIKRVAVLSEPINSAKVLLVVNDSYRKDFILLIEGKVIIKDMPNENLPDFDTALEDYFNGAIQLFKKSEKSDLERLKIILAWLSNNMEKAQVYYLKNYKSTEQLFIEINS